MALNSAFRTLSVVLVLMLALTGKAMSQSVLIPSPPQIAGSSYVLMDPKSGRIIMEENSHERLPPASLTKMMTAYIVERELDEGRIAMSDMVPISVNAWKTEGSRTFVREGTQVRSNICSGGSSFSRATTRLLPWRNSLQAVKEPSLTS